MVATKRRTFTKEHTFLSNSGTQNAMCAPNNCSLFNPYRKMESDRQKEEEGKVVNKRGREKSSKRQRRGEMGQENGEGQAKR